MPGRGVQAIILAAGLGTRLRPYTLLAPKPLLPVGDRPIIEHQLDWLRRNGIGKAIVVVQYLARLVRAYLGQGAQHGIRLSYVEAGELLGTAGQLKAAAKDARATFVCLYADTLLTGSLRRAIALHLRRRALATLLVRRYSHRIPYGLIDLDEKSRLHKWNEKPEVKGYINVGCYVLEPRFLRYIPRATRFGMDEAFRKAHAAGEPLFGYEIEGDYWDIGTAAAYRRADEQWIARIGKLP